MQGQQCNVGGAVVHEASSVWQPGLPLCVSRLAIIEDRLPCSSMAADPASAPTPPLTPTHPPLRNLHIRRLQLLHLPLNTFAFKSLVPAMAMTLPFLLAAELPPCSPA